MSEVVVIDGTPYNPRFPGVRYSGNHAVHTAGQRDLSNVYLSHYDPTCGWCWLGASHTDHAHRVKIERSRTDVQLNAEMSHQPTTLEAMNTTAASSSRDTIGWCDTRDAHDGRVDHRRQPTCRNFISDAEHTAQLIAQAREHDKNVTHRYPSGATTQSAAYIDEYRPY